VSERNSLPTGSGLRAQNVGLGSLFALGVNGIVGVGIFFTPSAIAGLVPGVAGAFTYLLTALLLAPVALTAALLGRHLAVNGGPYVWARAAFGPAAGWIVGWVAAVSAVLSTAAVLSGVGTQLSASFGPGWGRAPFSFGCATLLAAIAVFGLRPSAWVWNALTAIKLVPLLLLLALAFAPARPPSPAALEASQAVPDWGRALLVALFPLQGFEVVPVLAGSARGRNIVPVATLGALCFAGLLYAAIQLVCVRSVPELGLAKAPLAEAALALGGTGPARWVELGANVSALGIAFGMMVMTPRYLSALGAHAPRFAFLARSSARDVPHYALLLTLVAVILLSSLESLESLFVLSSSAVLVQYVAASASLIRLSLRRDRGLSAVAGVPALLTLGAAFLLALAIDLRELMLLAGLLGIGVLVLLARPRERR
jgi:APA family basic amino acid/polyamine antiporter